MRHLDIACGTGQPAIPAAKRVATVIACDTDPPMLRATARRAREAGVANLETREMNMHELRFPDASFDSATMGFALMFSPEPGSVVAEIRRVLKPGGRFALTVWDEPAKNPFFTTTFGAMAEATNSPPPPPTAPGPFRLSPPGELASVLRSGGFNDFAIEPVPFTYESASIGDHWQMFYDMALKSKIDALLPNDAKRVRELFDKAMEPYVIEGRVRIGATPLAATGTR